MRDKESLRSEIHKYIDVADERFLALIYGMIRADQSEYELSNDEIDLIEERLEDYKKRPNEGRSWTDVKSDLL